MKKILALSITFLLFKIGFSQDNDPVVIQFSGIVVTGDSAYGMPHVHIYVPKTRRGTETNEVGYFTMPALAGDSVVIKHIGFKKQYIILPDGKDKTSYTYIIEMKEDTTQLAEVTVMPYPTYQLFKEAFVSLDMPKDNDLKNWQKNMNKKDLEKMMLAMGPSSYENYRTYSLQEIRQIESSNIYTAYTNPLLNPFAWFALIQEVGKQIKEKKKQKEKDAYESDF